MEVTFSRIDIAACAANGQEPGDVVPRNPGDEWWVSYDAIRMDRPIRWSKTSRGEHSVSIPLVPYLTLPEADLAMAFLFQLGVRVSLDVGRPVIRLHLATGYPAQEVYEDDQLVNYRYWLGFGIVLGN